MNTTEVQRIPSPASVKFDRNNPEHIAAAAVHNALFRAIDAAQAECRRYVDYEGSIWAKNARARLQAAREALKKFQREVYGW